MTVRPLVQFVRRSCAISLKPARARHNSRLELLKQHLRAYLRRELTLREEQLLELSEPLFETPDIESAEDEQLERTGTE